jgi:hypothetical protein
MGEAICVKPTLLLQQAVGYVIVDADLVGDSAQQAATHFLGGLENGLLERKHIGGTMAFDNHAIQPKQTGAIVATRIKICA